MHAEPTPRKPTPEEEAEGEEREVDEEVEREQRLEFLRSVTGWPR